MRTDLQEELEYRKMYHKNNKNKINLKSSVWQKENYERHETSTQKWKANNPKSALMVGPRRRAKAVGIEFSITINDIVIPEFCPVLGIPLYAGTGKPCDNSPSLDRVDNTKGYIPGNVMVISYKANTLKRNGTAQEHLAIANYILQHQQQFGE